MKSFDESRSGAKLNEIAKVAKGALTKSTLWTGVRTITTEPMIRIFAEHKSSKIHCNISFGIHGTAVCVHTTRLIKHLFDVQSNCMCISQPCIANMINFVSIFNLGHRMVIWMQCWFKKAENIKLSNYLITLLVIFYFQMRKKLPSILTMQNGKQIKKCGGNHSKHFDAVSFDESFLLFCTA